MKFGRQWRNLLFDNGSVVYMNVAYRAVLSLEELYYGVKQFVEPHSALCNCGYHGNAHHAAQMLVVNLCTPCKQLVIHVECHDGTQVHVNEFRCKVEVAFKVRCHNGVYYDVRYLFEQMTAHIDFLRGISRYRICAWQVGYVDSVSLVVEASAFCIDCNTAVVAYMLVLVCQCIEY